VKLLLASLLAVFAAGCTAPGEPPAHPTRAQYQDLIRRETDKAQSSIETMRLVIDEIRHGRITENYATVMTRQSITDLTSVVTDLRQITPPAGELAHAQQQLRDLLTQAVATLGEVADNHRAESLAGIADELSSKAKQLQKLGHSLG
jgi:hypothetical protein